MNKVHFEVCGDPGFVGTHYVARCPTGGGLIGVERGGAVILLLQGPFNSVRAHTHHLLQTKVGRAGEVRDT